MGFSTFKFRRKTRKEQIEAQELTQYLKLKQKYDGN
jgi:hypothetical protein